MRATSGLPALEAIGLTRSWSALLQNATTNSGLRLIAVGQSVHEVHDLLFLFIAQTEVPDSLIDVLRIFRRRPWNAVMLSR